MSAPDSNGLLMAHPYGAVILIVLFLVVMAFLNLRWREKASTRRHRRYRATAGRVLNKLNSLPGDGQRLTYLRKISPYVFEELLLSAFERQGLAVVRNASYSVDGGLDGQVIIDGEYWLLFDGPIEAMLAQFFTLGIELRLNQLQGPILHAGPARPRLAISCPSMQVTTDAASPGMFTRMAVVEPPYMEP